MHDPRGGVTRSMALAGLVGLLALGACGGSAPSATTPVTAPGPGSVPPAAPPSPSAASAPPAGPAATPLEHLPSTPFATPATPPIDLSGVPARVHVEPPAARASWVGPAGGTIEATARDGTAYRLEIPEYALTEPTPITMTPVSAVDELGLSGGLAGAVYLQPSGLGLAVPATLTITTATSAPADTRLVGFDIADEGATTDLVPAAAGEGGQVRVAVHHFSAPGAAYGTALDLRLISQAAIPTRMSALLTMLLADPVPWDLQTRTTNGGLIDFQWLGSPFHTNGPAIGLQEVINAARNDIELLVAIKDWRMYIFALNLYRFNGDAAAAIAEGESYPGTIRHSHTVAYETGKSILARQFRAAIDGNERLCNATHDLHALANMWFWAGLGQRYAPDGAEWTGEARGCAELVVDVANLPTNLAAGGGDSLSLTFALEFTDKSKVPADVEATLGAVNFTFTAGGTTLVAPVAADTTLSAGVTATKGPPYTLNVSACWYLDGHRRGLCMKPDARQFGTGPSTPSPNGSVEPGASGFPDVSGQYQLASFCNRAGQPGNLGHGTGEITQSGSSVSIDWEMIWDSPDGLKTCGRDRIDLMQTHMHLDGQLEVDASGGVLIVFADSCGQAGRDGKIAWGRMGFFLPPCGGGTGGGTMVKAYWIP